MSDAIGNQSIAKLKARVRVLEVQYDAMSERRYRKFVEIQSVKEALVKATFEQNAVTP